MIEMMTDFIFEDMFDVPIKRVITMLVGVLHIFDTYASKDDFPKPELP